MEKISEGKSGKTIKILTYNFFLRPLCIVNSFSLKGDFKEERLVDFVDNHFNDYDIICFQEVFSWMNNRIQKLIKAGKK